MDLNPDSLETVVISVGDRGTAGGRGNGPSFPSAEQLRTPAEFCVVSVEAALAQMGGPMGMSSDLWVSREIGREFAEGVMGLLAPELYVNRVRVSSAFPPHKWVIERADGVAVGSDGL